MSLIAQVIINRPTRQLNESFSYLVPEVFGRIPEGTRVAVPLGNQFEEGIIVGYEESSPYTLKPISKVLDAKPWFTEEMLLTAQKLRDYYLCSYPQALELFTIDKKGLKEYVLPQERWLLPTYIDGVEALKGKRKQYALLQMLLEDGPMPVKRIKERGFSDSIISALLKTPFAICERREKKSKTDFKHVTLPFNIPLNEAQQACFSPIEKAIDEGKRETFLLHGVTGSGKTQVYINAAKSCLQNNKSCLVLVPEIILTTQIVERFVAAFGDEVVVFHSKLTKGERYNNWERLRRGDSHIIIGARSAVFAPAETIGLIIMDEEHDNSYKQEDMAHYHARKVAQWRADYHHCPIILGSATPSMESYYRAQQKEYTLLEMPDRVFKQALPKVTVVDMKEELFYGNRSVFSTALQELISSVLTMKKQMIILLNRRGYSTFVLCRECGKAIDCPHCDTSLVYHQHDHLLRCHYCDHTEVVPTVCPHCGSTKIKFFGSGTQRVEEELRRSFPGARVARLDQDSTAKRGQGDEVLEAFKEGYYDILLGTQMVAKGHDFENVWAVGVMTADSILNIPLYSAAERTFDLLTQTVGRAGRGLEQGKAVIQTYNPSHYAIINSKTQNYKAFYDEEIEARKILGYPPFKEMLHIRIQHKEENKLQELATKMEESLNSFMEGEESSTNIAGPYDEGLRRVRNEYRLSFMLRGTDLSRIKNKIKDSWIYKQPGIVIDVDPI